MKATPEGQSAVLHVDTASHQGSTQIFCTKDGVSAAAGGLEGVALQSSGLDMKVLSSDGVLVPTEEALRAKTPWTNHLSIELRPPESAKLPGGMRPVIRTQFAKQSVVQGDDTVKTEAGEFPALKVQNVTTASAGASGTDRKVESTMWLAPGVGIVKVATGDSPDLELLQIERPQRAEAEAKKPARKH